MKRLLLVLVALSLFLPAEAKRRWTPIIPAPSGFTVSSTSFNGTDNSIGHATAVCSDGATGTFSIWVKETTAFDKHIFFANASGFIELARGAGSFPIMTVYDASSVPKIVWTSTVQVYNDTPTPLWHHILISFDLSGPTFSAYVDDTSAGTAVTLVSGTAHFGATDWFFGQTSAGVSFLAATVSEVYFTNEYIDITNSTNRRKFDDGSTAPGHPVSLGPTGNLPTGTTALVYFHNPFGSFGTNVGSGSGWTTNGTLSTDGSTP